MDVRTLNSIVQGIGQGITNNQRLGQEERRLRIAERMADLDEQVKRGEIDVQTAVNSLRKAQAQYGEKALPGEFETKALVNKQTAAAAKRALDVSAREDWQGTWQQDVDNSAERKLQDATYLAARSKAGTPRLAASSEAGAVRLGLQKQAFDANRADTEAQDRQAFAETLYTGDPATDGGIDALLNQGQVAQAVAASEKGKKLVERRELAVKSAAARRALEGVAAQDPRALRAAEAILGPAVVRPGSTEYVPSAEGMGVRFVTADGKEWFMSYPRLMSLANNYDEKGNELVSEVESRRQSGLNLRAKRAAEARIEAGKALASIRANTGDAKEQSAMVERLRKYVDLMAELSLAGEATPGEVAEARSAYEQALKATGALPASAVNPGALAVPKPGMAAVLGAGTYFDLIHTPQ